jgi:SAM-dependent methyltransferase
VGVDIKAPAQVLWDLGRFPYPWPDNSVDAVRMSHSLEHCDDLLAVVKEVHRILKPGGLFWVIVPHASGTGAFKLEHKHFFNRMTFGDIAAGCEHISTPVGPMFDEVSYRVRLVFGRPAGFLDPIRILDFLASHFPLHWEKTGVLPPDEIEWRGTKRVENT